MLACEERNETLIEGKPLAGRSVEPNTVATQANLQFRSTLVVSIWRTNTNNKDEFGVPKN